MRRCKTWPFSVPVTSSYAARPSLAMVKQKEQKVAQNHDEAQYEFIIEKKHTLTAGTMKVFSVNLYFSVLF